MKVILTDRDLILARFATYDEQGNQSVIEVVQGNGRAVLPERPDDAIMTLIGDPRSFEREILWRGNVDQCTQHAARIFADVMAVVLTLGVNDTPDPQPIAEWQEV